MFEGRLAFSRRPPGEKPLDADVFIDGFPMNPTALCNEAPPLALISHGVSQSRIPGERDRYGATVGKVNVQRVARDRYRLGKRNLDFNRGNIHSKPPKSGAGVRSPAFRSD